MRLAPPLLLAAALLAAAACGKATHDTTPPTFAGLESVTPLAAGSARLSWSAAADRSKPVTYDVYAASSTGREKYTATPIATTTQTTIDLTGLPGGALESFFVVRARDAKGNEDTNTVEKSVSFAPNRLSLRGTYPEPIAGDIAISSAGTIAAMGSYVTDPQVRAWVFDVSSASNPVLKATLYGPGRSTDVEIHGNLLWVATEDNSTGEGAYAYDISNPDAISQTPIGTISESTHSGLGQCHTIWLEDDATSGKTILYCNSLLGDGDIHVVDVTDPLNPVQLSQIGFPGCEIHDVYTKGSFGVGSFLSCGWAFIDFSDKSNPVMGTHVTYQGNFTHNAWPSADENYLFTTDELPGGHLRVWDIHDRANPVQVGEFIPDPLDHAHAIVHNVQVVGTTAFVSHYEAGVQVLDVSDPANPVSIGWYDTYPGPTTVDFNGDWGVAEHLPYVYVSDLQSGLWVFELQ